MRLLLIFVSLVTSFRVQIINDTRLDLVTRHYPQITNLVMCNSSLCNRLLIENPSTRIIMLPSASWSNVVITVDLFAANGTQVRHMETRVDKPIHETYYWPLVTLCGALVMGIIAYAILWYFPKPQKDKEYQSQKERDRLLARDMGMIQ